MPKYVYAAIALTGGTPGTLDSISGDTFQDGDCAVAFSGGYAYFYTLKDNCGKTENLPYVVCPDFNALTKRWVLDTIHANTAWVDATNFTGVFKQEYDNLQKLLDGLNVSFNNKCFGMVDTKLMVKDIDFKVEDQTKLLRNVYSFSDLLTKLDNMFSLSDFKIVDNKVTNYCKPIEVSDDITLTTQTFILVNAKEMQDVHITLNSCKLFDHVKIARTKDTYTTKVIITPFTGETIEGLSEVILDKSYQNINLISDEKVTWYRL